MIIYSSAMKPEGTPATSVGVGVGVGVLVGGLAGVEDVVLLVVGE